MYLKGFGLFFFLHVLVSFSQEQKTIDFSADKIKYAKNIGAQVLVGNVVFKNEGTIITCDSACRYENNTVKAFQNILIRKGDSLRITGNTLKYDGNSKLAELEGNVVCKDADMILTTPFLTYNLRNSTASYSGGGTIVTKSTTLTSKIGTYHSGSKLFTFKTNVKLNNPDYKVDCDTLQYNTSSKTAFFVGPTEVFSGKSKLYCQKGWYNSEKQTCQLFKNAYIFTERNQIYADSIYYDKKAGYGILKNKVKLVDTLNKAEVCGNKAEYYESEGRSVVTKNAILIKKMQKDTFLLAADTLISKRLNVRKEASDSAQIRALHHVRFIYSNVAGIADSMNYTTVDSLITLYNNPILWNDSTQLSALKMDIKLGVKGMKKMDLSGNAFLISYEGKNRFNQIKGKTISVLFKNDTLDVVHVYGETQVSYFLKNDNKKIIGLNKTNCKNLSVYFHKNEIHKITFKGKPSSKLIPIKQVQPEKELLKGFAWLPQKKPKYSKQNNAIN